MWCGVPCARTLSPPAFADSQCCLHLARAQVVRAQTYVELNRLTREDLEEVILLFPVEGATIHREAAVRQAADKLRRLQAKPGEALPPAPAVGEEADATPGSFKSIVQRAVSSSGARGKELVQSLSLRSVGSTEDGSGGGDQTELLRANSTPRAGVDEDTIAEGDEGEEDDDGNSEEDASGDEEGDEPATSGSFRSTGTSNAPGSFRSSTGSRTATVSPGSFKNRLTKDRMHRAPKSRKERQQNSSSPRGRGRRDSDISALVSEIKKLREEVAEMRPFIIP